MKFYCSTRKVAGGDGGGFVVPYVTATHECSLDRCVGGA